MPQPKTRSTRNKSTQSNQQTSKKIDETIEKTKEKGKQIVSDAKEETSKIAEQQLQTVAHQINSLASSLTKTADNMEDAHTWIADGTRQTAKALERVSGSISESDFGTLVHNFEDYTRRQPVIVLGGAAIAGFFLAKFLKNSSDHVKEITQKNDD
ncbi:hypothetical protein SAMN05216302_102244 [Nitrosomonas aestuarii]|uniref:Membrane-anchored ribosome-binding protein, inhibits growth in stationary phase, ElaB/YqjD/DUF883 family n=1 Tax=Nitrosomonas aestuarii TaxID=52441 RepID=A0A1I4DS45_9PROT|nr:hypothetical protein [Nitrosomonas aestuarii]SFK95470.1 hypothetical protein SAMN05216302_102244 [Nitrosomonas aestuarii]